MGTSVYDCCGRSFGRAVEHGSRLAKDSRVKRVEQKDREQCGKQVTAWCHETWAKVGKESLGFGGFKKKTRWRRGTRVTAWCYGT